MTGRDGGAPLAPIGEYDPVIILVRPQLAENIGTCARAMANGGLFRLRLVTPRDGWPQIRAWPASSGADRILEAAEVFPTLDEAVADLHQVFATCPRPRHAIIQLEDPKEAAGELRRLTGEHLQSGILFGPERAGLDAEELARADTLIRYPLNPDFMSLNLAQAVMIMSYEWWMAGQEPPAPELLTHKTHIATKGELNVFFTRLEAALDETGFLRNEEKRPGMVRNLRHFFNRGQVTEQELRTLHGIISALQTSPAKSRQQAE